MTGLVSACIVEYKVATILQRTAYMEMAVKGIWVAVFTS